LFRDTLLLSFCISRHPFMKITLYGIKNCDTMKKAFSWLEDKGVGYEFHDYKKSGVPGDRLKDWAKRAGWEKLLNTRGTTYRKIPEGERDNLNEAHALKLMQKYPSSIKRPVVEAGTKLLVGFDGAEFTQTLGK